jgi:Uma2 family endonuclease
MSSAASKTYLTPEQYEEIEEQSEIRHEYYRGEMFAMSGASESHNLVAANLARSLGNQLEDRPCKVYQTDMRVLINATGLYTYPDVVVVCEPPRFTNRKKTTLLNPTVLIEVISPSTEKYDRTTKGDHFKTIESLREHVLVSQDQVRVDVSTRTELGWVSKVYTDRNEVLRLESIGCEVPLSKIYAKVELPEVSPLRPTREVEE